MLSYRRYPANTRTRRLWAALLVRSKSTDICSPALFTLWSYQFPDRADPALAAQVEEASDWHNDPPTERQISYLRSIGIPTEDGLTKGRACQLIGGEPTEGQLRRLMFYGITPAPYLTKEEASELLDGYMSQHPESEEEYQTWKLGGCGLSKMQRIAGRPPAS